MFNGRKDRGQTLVEVALVLPLLGLAVAVGVQWILVCHNMIKLQVDAEQLARQMTIESPNPPPVQLFSPFWGRATPPRPKPSTLSLQPWRPFKGESTVKVQGYLRAVKVKSQLFPESGFGSVLPKVNQEASAETLLEPPVPQEN